MNAREVALKALIKVDFEQGYSNIVIDNALDNAKLQHKDAALASALFYGVLERRLTLDAVIARYSKLAPKKVSKVIREILRIGAYQLLYMDKVPPFAAVNECVKLAKLFGQGHASGYVNAVLRNIQRAKNPLPDNSGNPKEDLSVRYSAPKWLVSLWMREYKDQNITDMLLSTLSKAPITARVNTKKTSADRLIELLAESGVKAVKTNVIEDSLHLSLPGDVEKLEMFRQGLFHIQDLSSQICCYAVNPQKGERIIDVCSAPGGKAFTMAQMMEGGGQVLAFDLHESRTRLIADGAKRLGLDNIVAGVRDAAKPSTDIQPADAVLCDVPCSGLGIIRRKPEIKYKPLNTDLPDLQYLILHYSASLVKKGGRLIYSTCTLNPEENSAVARRFLKEHAEFEPLALRLPSAIERRRDEPKNEITLMPHIHATDGFFIAGFVKVK